MDYNGYRAGGSGNSEDNGIVSAIRVALKLLLHGGQVHNFL